MEQEKRIELIDAIRGFSLFPMVLQHVAYDLCAFCGLPWVWFENPVSDLIHYIFGSMFVLLAGISSNFSRSNVRRGLKTLAVALCITLVTCIMGMPIVFGVLHLLGSCMLLYGLTERFWQRLPSAALPVLCVIGIVCTLPLINGYPTDIPHLWILGLTTPDFYSSDYFPLLPWGFLFLLGVWAGRYVRQGRLPRRFYEVRSPFLAALGRRSLWIYVLHQPAVYALIMLGLFIFGER